MPAGPARSEQNTSVPTPLEDILCWSASSIDDVLLEAPFNPRAVIPFVAPGTSWFYWELHFQDRRATRTDFLHRSSLKRGVSWDGFFSPDPILGRLREWYFNEPAVRHYHDTAWLEIDGPLKPGRALKQGVSVCLEPDIGNRVNGDAPLRPTPQTVVDSFCRLQAACGQPPQGAQVLGAVHSALESAGGHGRHLSVMRGRSGSPAKVYAALPHGSLPELLATIAWPGDRAAACQLAELACAESGRLNIDLSFQADLLPRIAFEHFFDPSPARDPSRRAATSLACSLGLLSPPQAAALAGWVGSFRVKRGNAPAIRVVRWFDLKFVLSPEGLEFKAYLGFRTCSD